MRPSSAPVRRLKQQEAAAALAKAVSPKKKEGPGNQDEPADEVLIRKKVKKVVEDEIAYTYDLNGRKVILTESDRESMMKLKQRKEAMANIEDVTELLNRQPIPPKSSSGSNQPTGPTLSAWPSARVERSAEEYVKKQQEARNLEHGVKECIQPKPR